MSELFVFVINNASYITESSNEYKHFNGSRKYVILQWIQAACTSTK